MVMGIPACCEKTRWDFFLFFDLVLRGELGEAPVPNPSPLKTPDAIALAITSPAVGLGSSGYIENEGTDNKMWSQCAHTIK